jgi:DNA-binding Lrp family transcriptional regulator
MSEKYGVLTDIFGYNPETRILEVFVENWNDELMVSDVSRMSDISGVALKEYITKLLEEGIIEAITTIKPQTYKLNMKNTKAMTILMLERYMVSERLGKILVRN